MIYFNHERVLRSRETELSKSILETKDLIDEWIKLELGSERKASRTYLALAQELGRQAEAGKREKEIGEAIAQGTHAVLIPGSKLEGPGPWTVVCEIRSPRER